MCPTTVAGWLKLALASTLKNLYYGHPEKIKQQAGKNKKVQIYNDKEIRFTICSLWIIVIYLRLESKFTNLEFFFLVQFSYLLLSEISLKLKSKQLHISTGNWANKQFQTLNCVLDICITSERSTFVRKLANKTL